MGYFKLIFLLFGIIGFSKSQECIVKDQKTNSEKPCSFPFILNSKIYYGCTADFDETEDLACSTKTDSLNRHIDGKYCYFYIHTMQNTNEISPKYLFQGIGENVIPTNVPTMVCILKKIINWLLKCMS